MNSAMKFNMMVVMTSWAPVRAFNRPASPPQSCTADDRPENRKRDVDDHWSGEGETNPEADHATDVHLPIGTDVEQTRLESDGDGQTGQNQRRGGEQGFGDRMPGAERALEQRTIRIADATHRRTERLAWIVTPQLQSCRRR